MALTVVNSSGGAELPKGVFGDLQYRVLDITFDSSYLTGGELLTAEDIGLSKVWFSIIPVAEDTSGTDVSYSVLYDIAAGKLKAYNVDVDAVADLDGSIEVASAADLSAVTVRCVFFGES
jgi:hypothetical protein